MLFGAIGDTMYEDEDFVVFCKGCGHKLELTKELYEKFINDGLYECAHYCCCCCKYSKTYPCAKEKKYGGVLENLAKY